MVLVIVIGIGILIVLTYTLVFAMCKLSYDDDEKFGRQEWQQK